MAYNDYVAQPWYAPAGFNRGSLNILEADFIFNQGDRDALYSAGINPVQTFKGRGTVIWGQKTLQIKASALDRLNVRRMLIVLEKSIAISLQDFAFEPNSVLTRFKVSAMVTSFLDTLSAQGAFQTEAGDRGYRVVCDTTNNTPDVIDRNELHVDVFVKPSRAAEFIQLQVIVTNTGVSFDELIAQGALG
jgi:phage tail sheath protein FI